MHFQRGQRCLQCRMGFLDRLKTRNTSPEEPRASAQSSEYVGTDFTPSGSQGLSQAQDLSLNEDLTNFASSPRGEGRLYNPYEGLSNAVDPRVLRSVYKLPSQPEFLFSEQATVHRRSWSENLTYYTGTGYATGALLGGGWGATRALRPNPALQGVGSTRLKVNQFLNLSGKSGRVASNALGVLGLFFSASESGLGYLSDGVTPDYVNTLGAGFVTGALFRSTRGPRAAGVAGLFGLTAAMLLIAARETVNQGL